MAKRFSNPKSAKGSPLDDTGCRIGVSMVIGVALSDSRSCCEFSDALALSWSSSTARPSWHSEPSIPIVPPYWLSQQQPYGTPILPWRIPVENESVLRRTIPCTMIFEIL